MVHELITDEIIKKLEDKSKLLDEIVTCIENLGFGESRALPFCIESFPELKKLLAEYKKINDPFAPVILFDSRTEQETK